MRFRVILPALLTVIMLLAGCAGSGRVRYDSAQDAFDKGKAAYERGNYQRAIEYFQGVFNYGRTGQIAADAQLFLARSYVGNGEYILAANEFSRFTEIYRNDPRRADAEFERAMAYYKLSPAFELDQSDTERAINTFMLFISRFPNAPQVPEAQKYIEELTDKMAHKQYAAAELYERRELYEAAAITFEGVFDKYPGTQWADDALLGALRSYLLFSEQSVEQKVPERLQKAVDNYRRMTQIFPDSPLMGTARQLGERAIRRLAAAQAPDSTSAHPSDSTAAAGAKP